MPLLMRATTIDADTNTRLHQTPWEDSGYERRVDLFRHCQRTHGRPTRGMYVAEDGQRTIGWLFARKARREDGTPFTCHVWVEVREE